MHRTLARVAIILTLGIATLSYGALEKRVTVLVEGVPIAVRTFAGSVGDALDRAGIDIGPRDSVAPTTGTALADGATIEVRRAKQITLLLDGEPRRVVVTGLTIAEVLREIELRGTMVDRVHPSRATTVRAGMTITYDRAVALTVHVDGKERDVITNAPTVRAVVRELGIELRKNDFVLPRPSLEPRDNMSIRVMRVGVRTQTRSVSVPYRTILRRDGNLEYGERKVVQDGVAGLRRVRERLKFHNGDLVSRVILGTDTVREARARIIAIGSGYPGCACNDGSDTGDATWYGEADGLTAAHRTLPLGTVVRVENVANGKWVNVTIRDRGPYGEGRIIDLSDEAFSRIASLSTGVVRVRIFW